MVSSLRKLRVPFRRSSVCSCVSLIVVALIVFVTVLRYPQREGKLSESFGLPESFGGLSVPWNALPEREVPPTNELPAKNDVQAAKDMPPAKDVSLAKDEPEWCSELIQNPRPSGLLWGKCFERGRYGVKCSDGKPRFFSQYSQDMLLYLYHFRYLKRPGTYLDLATNEPVKICKFL